MWEFVKNACRYICSLIDWAAYRVLSSVYDLFTEISQLTLYNENIMKVISKRIFLILGIFMLFRIAISLITYIISPDKTNDSKAGGKKLITNIIISLFLLATVNIIFEEAYKIQKKVVETRIVEKIFFGQNGNENDVSLSYLLYSAFLSPNEKAVSNCETLFDQFQPISLDCSYNLTNAGLSNKMTVGINHVNNEHDFSKVLSDYELINYDIDGEYFFNYTPIISTICAIIVILMIVSFTLDLAIRIVKLLFLQIISPIPIIANMDPSKGEGIFKKWVKQCTDTYLSLFIRITAINFAVFMIVLIKSNFAEIFTGKSVFVTIILIIGCLMFAKQVPKLIEDLIGIKFDGMMLHPLKKMEDKALFGKQISGLTKGTAKGALAGATGILPGALGAGVASKALGNGKGETTWATIRGAGRGLVGGFGTGFKSKTALDAAKAGIGRKNTEAEYVNSLDGTDFAGRVKAGLQQRWNIATDEEKTKKQLDAINSFSSSIDTLLKRAESESVKHNDLQAKDSAGNLLTMEQHKQEQEKLNMLRNQKPMDFNEFAQSMGLKNYDDFANERGGDFEQTKADYNELLKEMQKRHQEYELEQKQNIQKLSDKVNKDTKIFANEYATQVALGKIDDAETSELISYTTDTRNKLGDYYTEEEMNTKFKIYAEDANGNRYFSGKETKDSKGRADAEKIRIEKTKNKTDRNGKAYNEYERQKANAAATKPKKK